MEKGINMETQQPQHKTLTEYMEQYPEPEGFEASPQYFADGDYLALYFKDECCYAQRIDDLVTVFRSSNTSDLVGFKIKGVAGLAKHVSSFIGIHDNNIHVNLLLLSASGNSPAKNSYYELAEQSKDFTVSKDVLCPA